MPPGCTEEYGPEWVPIPIEEPTIEDPIDSLLARYSRALNDTAVFIYDNKSLPEVVEYALTGILYNGQIKNVEVRAGTDSLNSEPNLFWGRPDINLLFVWHTHISLSDNPTLRGSFSPNDIDLLRLARCMKQNFISFADCRNKRYALVISDLTKARAFFNSTTREEIMELYKTTLNGDTQFVDEESIKNVIGPLTTNGIGFYVSYDAPNFQSWTILN